MIDESQKVKLVIAFRSDTGKSPYEDWIIALKDVIGKAIILKRITRLEETGNYGLIENVGEGVIEFKISYGPGYRVYCADDGDKIVILLGGGSKKRQQVDIDTAKEN